MLAAVEDFVVLDDPAKLLVFLQEGFVAVDLEADEPPDALQLGEFLFLILVRPGLGLGQCGGYEKEEQTTTCAHDGLLQWR